MLCCRALTLSGFRRLTGIMRDINLLIWIMTRASRLTGMCIVTWGGLGGAHPRAVGSGKRAARMRLSNMCALRTHSLAYVSISVVFNSSSIAFKYFQSYVEVKSAAAAHRTCHACAASVPMLS